MAGLIGHIAADVIPLVSKISPLLGTLLGSPVAGVAVNLIAHAFGVSSSALDGLGAAIANDPDAAVKIKQVEAEHGVLLAQASVADTMNARQRSIMEEQITGKRDWVTPALAFFFVVIYAVVQVYAIYNPSSQDDIISARLQDIILMIVGYYFGSSMRRPVATK